MYKRHITALYAINIVFQAILTLLMNIGLALLLSYLAVTYWGAEGWIYAPLVILGVLTGLVSMIKFLLSSMRALESLEEQHRQDEKRARAEARRTRERECAKENGGSDENKDSLED